MKDKRWRGIDRIKGYLKLKSPIIFIRRDWAEIAHVRDGSSRVIHDISVLFHGIFCVEGPRAIMPSNKKP